MNSCYQFKDMTVLQHGQSVAAWYEDLINERKFGWRLPEWIDHPSIQENLIDKSLMKVYQVYHDCGKPLCKEVDSEGKQHFPNHAESSYDRWLECSNDSVESRIVGNLIRSDMDCHTLKGEDISDFINRPEAPSLILTALAEVHSNAQMFGGIESDSFKIKWKKIDKIGKKLVSLKGVHYA